MRLYKLSPFGDFVRCVCVCVGNVCNVCNVGQKRAISRFMSPDRPDFLAGIKNEVVVRTEEGHARGCSIYATLPLQLLSFQSFEIPWDEGPGERS